MSPINLRYANEMFSGLSEHLSSAVARRFAAAKQAGALVLSSTELTTIRTSSLSFQLRYCPALAAKPSNPPKPVDVEPERPRKKPDPFHDPPTDLLIAEIPESRPTHILVLNKFPVIRDHFILATKAYKSQTDLLQKADLEATFACLKEWESGKGLTGSKRLFAFFNSGEHSGASQPHRHLQFLPVENMIEPDGEQNWAPLIDTVLDPSAPAGTPRRLNLPFACFAASLPPEPSADDIHNLYLSMYRLAAKEAGEAHLAERELDTEVESPASVSYNLAMTTSGMAICPRRSEAALIRLDSELKDKVPELGLIKLNGTILGGTLMVKEEAEWNELRKQPALLDSILKDIGFSPQTKRT